MIWDASVLATNGQTAVAASVVVKDDAHQLLPLLAFLVTEPEHQRQGLGQSVLAETLLRMDALDTRELHLAVNSANRARSLYHRLGFEEHPPRAVRPA